MTKPTILLTEKSNSRSCLTEEMLEVFHVIRNSEAREVFSLVSLHKPDLIILDAHMPDISGYDLLRTLKAYYKTEKIPVVLAAEIHEDVEPCLALELGAIDFIIKPISEHLITAKINNYIKLYHSMLQLEERATTAKEMNPNTGLPGNKAIKRFVLHALQSEESQVVVYADLDNFKSYNDAYGFGKGDQIIKMTADIIERALANAKTDTFLGHVGGDDFVFVAPATKIKEICDEIIYDFDEEVRTHYDLADCNRGFIVSKDRQNRIQKFPIMTISMAGVNLAEHAKNTRYEYIADICAEVKKYAKSFNNSCFYMDRRHKLVEEEISTISLAAVSL